MTAKEVLLEGASPWGFRMTGGADVAIPLRISRVNPGSKAASKGIREGDLITSINKHPTRSLTNSQSHALLRTVRENLLLGLNQDADVSSPKKKTKDKQSAQADPHHQGEKKSTSKLRRERRTRLKSRLKGLLGLGKEKREERSEKGDESEDGSWARLEEASSGATSRRLSLESVGYDNLAVARPTSPREDLVLDTLDTRLETDLFLRTEREHCSRLAAPEPSYSALFQECTEYLRGGMEHCNPPDLVVSTQGPIDDSGDYDTVEFKTVRVNDLNNNKARTGTTDKLSVKKVHIVHTAEECRVEESPGESDSPGIEIAVQCLPDERTQLCKAIVIFEDGSGRPVDESNYEEIDCSRCYPYYLPVRRYLDVIKEETSDLSDGEKPREKSGDGTGQGIDTSWRDGKSLEDLSDVPVVSDSPSDTDLHAHDTDSTSAHIYVNTRPIIKPKVPSLNIVKSVVASYYNNKGVAVPFNKVSENLDSTMKPLQISPSTIECPKNVEDIEIVYIDSSDSEALSGLAENVSSPNSSNRSSTELLDLSTVIETSLKENSTKILNNKNISNKAEYDKEQLATALTESNNKRETMAIEKFSLESEKCLEEVIEISKSISDLSKEAGEPLAHINKIRSRNNSKDNGKKNIFDSENSELDFKNFCYDSSKSSSSSRSTAKCIGKEVPSLKKLSSEVMLNIPEGKTLMRQLGLDEYNVDSGSEYLPETSEYSNTSRLSFTSTDNESGTLNKVQLSNFSKTDDEEKVLSSGGSSFVFISSPGVGTFNEPWIGMPLQDDPRYIVCFSPSQLQINLQPDVSKASELLDLHKKFVHRRGYHETVKENEPDLISLDMSHIDDKDRYTPEILSDASNLLALQEYHKSRQDKMKMNDLHLNLETTNEEEVKELNSNKEENRVNNKLESTVKREHNEEVGSSRLLELIQKEEVKSSNSPERSMLVEKSTVEPVGDQKKEKTLDAYAISKKGDIAIKKTRPKSVPSGEVFRQNMYEEYMGKVAERQERRQMKVLIVSEQSGERQSGDQPGRLEAEFMDKVKRRMEKLGMAEDGPEESPSQEPLPKHLQEFVDILTENGVWSPAQTPEPEKKKEKAEEPVSKEDLSEPEPVVWTPSSAGASPTLDRKKYRQINFQSPPPIRKAIIKQEDPDLPKELPSEQTEVISTQRKLPPAQNPTITLLQKAREGQIPKGAQYLDSEQTVTSTVRENEVLYNVKKEYDSEAEENKKKIVELTPRKFEGIGPTTKEGTPIALRSEVKEDNQQRWYKRMYDSLHKTQNKNFVTVKYKSKRKDFGPSWSSSGYLSEPERGCYDSDTSLIGSTLERRTTSSSTLPRNNRYSAGVRHAVNIYKNQPGRIEDYEPGYSSIAEKEKQLWWDEVMDIFDGELRAESKVGSSPSVGSVGKPWEPTGYESDSTLVFKRRPGSDMSLEEQKMAYKVIQKGGDVPLHGLRKPPPNKPKEPHGRSKDYSSLIFSPDSGREYLESEVNIHYRSPIRTEAKEYIEEGELARRQAEAMRRIYQQQRRAKYLAELNDIHSRRHTDYFMPSQKSPIPLNRYDDFPMEPVPPRPRDRTPEPKLVARALYNFVGQSSRELSFRRGDIIYVRRQVDKNWYEGEHNAMIGLFPINYVEIIPYDGIRTLPKKSTEGQARAKFNFQAQSHLELSLVKGELVLLTRRVDENWFEGRIGTKKGIFPVSYVQVLVEPGETIYGAGKPLVAPASHSIMLNGAKDLGSQVQPPRPPSIGSPTKKESSQISQLLHIDTRSDPVPYRAMYNYKPQNDDELELREGDVVYVMEKCDDGWYVGSLHRNGQFGTFPGNYVQRIH